MTILPVCSGGAPISKELNKKQTSFNSQTKKTVEILTDFDRLIEYVQVSNANKYNGFGFKVTSAIIRQKRQ